VGTHNFLLDFTWTMGVVTSNPDEAAIRLGLACNLANLTACDYPGAGSRNIANDGHFTSITATLGEVSTVPTPGALPLCARGLASLGWLCWRKKRREVAAA